MISVKSLFIRVWRSQLVKTLAVFAGANMIASALLGVGGIIQARWISPEVLGEFSKYGILTTYLAIALIVVQDGFMRQFAYLMGKGDKEEACKIAATAKCWYVFVSFVFGCIFGVLTLMAALRQDWHAVVGWGVQIFVAIGSSYGVYLQTIYRRSMEFKRLSYNSLIANIVSFVLIASVKFLGYYGIALRMFFSTVVRLFYDARYLPVRVKMNWNRTRFFSLAKISIPLSIEGYIRTSFLSATFGYLVFRYCGERDLGLYGIAASFEAFAMLFINSLNQIANVRLANKFGETESIPKTLKSILPLTAIGFASSVALAAGFCIVIGPFVRTFVPNYVGAIPVAYVLSSSLVLSSVAVPLNILRTALMYKCIYAMSIIQIVTLVTGVLIVPKSIEWFAFARVAALAASMVIGYAMLIRFCIQGGQNED